MAIARDASANGYSASGNTLSYSHTCTGTNLLLWVAIWQEGPAAPSVTSVTYNGVAMTLGLSYTPTTNEQALFYYLAAPTTGANTVSITQSTTGEVESCSVSYTGAKQTGIPDATGTQFSASGTTITETVNSIADNCWALAFSGNQRTMSASTGSTLVTNGPHWSTGLFDTNGPKTPAGLISMSQTLSSSSLAGGIIATFAPFVASTATGSTALLMGV